MNSMDEQMKKTCDLAEPALACRLRRKLWSRRGPVSSPTAGEVEIENVSSRVIEIEVRMHPLQYLSLEIADAAGKPVPASPYGDVFSPHSTTYLFRLAPGEKYIHNVGLLNGVPEEKRLPGIYMVRAMYKYKGLKAVSEPLEVQIPEPVSASTGEVASRLR
jgi:hypothetical protein